MRRLMISAGGAVLLVLWVGARLVLQAQAPTVEEIRRQLGDRYDVVALQQGVALVPRRPLSTVRLIQVVDGAVTVDGDALTAAQLRARLGADTDVVIKISYLDRDAQRALAGAPPAVQGLPSDLVGPPGAAQGPPSDLVGPPGAALGPANPERAVRRDGDIVRIGGPVTVGPDEHVRGDVVGVFGPVNVDGEVTGDVVAVMGSLTLGPHAVVGGNVQVVGGPLVRAPESRVSGQVNEVGIGAGGGRRFGASRRFGPPWGGVGGLIASAMRLLLVTLLGLLVVALAGHRVEEIAARAAAAPMRSALAGLAAEILFVPVLLVTIFALVVSIVGIPLLVLVPFAVVLVGLAMLVGYTGAASYVGATLLGRLGREGTGPYATLATGMAAIAAVTLVSKAVAMLGGSWVAVPFAVVGYLIEYLAWTVGCGAAMLAWVTMRRTRHSIQPPPTTTSAS